jgi:multiple RNA-binding domain-containing protein 1
LPQISDVTLPKSRKAQREEEREHTKARIKQREEAESTSSLNAGTKRKRTIVDESDPKLKEYLEVMQPASKLKTLAKSIEDESIVHPPTKIQALEIPEGQSDGEYEMVPKKSRKKSPAKYNTASAPAPVAAVIEQSVAPSEHMSDTIAPNPTDDDWLRSRTNRLLDLMDPEDIITGGTATLTSENIELVAETSDNIEQPVDLDHKTAELRLEEEDEEKPDPTIEAIKTNGRLFVRNLPYSASVDDLRRHFEAFGSLDEVRFSTFSSSVSLPFYDEYPDRDSLCFKHVM